MTGCAIKTKNNNNNTHPKTTEKLPWHGTCEKM
jgi:hypothetical protein